MKILPSLILITLTGWSGLTAQAQDFAVHFLGNQTQDPVTGAAGVVSTAGWNNIANGTFTTGLVTSTNSLTTATLTLSGPSAPGTWSTTGGAVATYTGGNDSLMHGYMDGTKNNVGTATLTGLTAPAYTIYVYAMGDLARPSNGGDLLPNYSVNGTTLYTATLGGAFTGFTQGGTATANSSTTVTAAPAFGNYIVFSNVVPVGGQIAISAEADTTTWRSPLNGFQLVAVPEPSTTALGLAGLLGAVGYAGIRRRRSAAV